MKVKAAVLYEIGKDLSIETVELAEPRENEVLVRITATGVCHSDLSIARGTLKVRLPSVLGHEAAGVVERCGPGVSKVKPGQRIAINWTPHCGHCFYCLEGHPMLCEPMVEGRAKGGLLDGERLLSRTDGGKLHHMSCTSSFADYAVIPESGCVPIGDDIPDTIAALVGCAVTTGFGAAVNDAGIKPGGSVAVWGAGGVGLNAIMGAVIQGAERIVAVDPNPRKEAVAKRFGATDYINPREVNDVPGAIREMTGGRGIDASIDCTGRLSALEQGWDSLRKAGTLVSVGIPHEGDVFKIEARMIPNSMRRLVGSYYGGGVPERDFRRIFDLYRRGRMDLDALVGETLPLEGINDAFRKLEAGYDTRMVITFDGARESLRQ